MLKNNSDDDDEDNYHQAAFERFMMGATKTVDLSSTPNSATISSPTRSLQKRKPEKQYSTIIKAFQGTLQRDWLEVDDNLAEVMRSISNLRDRIYWSSQLLLKQQNVANNKEVDWKCSDCAPRVHLWNEEIELALKYEMQQHEQMMAGARSLLSNLNQAQEALGRRLAEGMQYENELQYEWFARGEYPPPSEMFKLEEAYRILAAELYSKQRAVQGVLDSTNDYLLANGEDVITEDENPRKVASRCTDKWNRVSENLTVRDVLSLYNNN